MLHTLCPASLDVTTRLLEKLLRWRWRAAAGLETVRIASGAGTNTRDNPLSLAEFVPSTDAGGLFDNKLRGGARSQKAS